MGWRLIVYCVLALALTGSFLFITIENESLSSKENSEVIVNKVNNGGLPAFFEVFKENDKLFAVYVGPFVSESDIVNNMDTIKRLSESQNGEILRWKLSD